jgi:hypothetical protein
MSQAKPNTMAKTIEHAYQDLQKALATIAENTQKAGDLVAWLLDHDKNARNRLRALGLQLHQVARLERIGRGRIIAELAVKTTLFDHLPVADQRTVLTQKVPAVFPNKDSTGYTVRQVNLLEEDLLTQNRVVGDTKLRNVEEQKEYVESFVKPKPLSKKASSWRISRAGKVVFLSNSSYSKEQIEEILAALTKYLKEHGLEG